MNRTTPSVARLSVTSLLIAVIAMVATLWCSPPKAQGANAYGEFWTGTLGSNWSNVGNWTTFSTNGAAGSFPASAPSSGWDSLLFNSGSGTVNIDASGIKLNEITFDLAAGAYTIGANGGNALNPSTSGATTNLVRIFILPTLAGAGITETIAAPLIITPYNSAFSLGNWTPNNATSIAVPGITGSNNKLVLSGSITNTALTTINLLGLGDSAITGNIIQGTGAINLNVEGIGTWTLSGSNSYTGTTVVNGGTLALDFTTNNAANSKINSAAALTLGNTQGGTLKLIGNNSAASSQTVTGLNVNAGGSGIAVVPGSGQSALLTMGNIVRNTGGTLDMAVPAVSSSTNGIQTLAANTAGTILGGWATVGKTDWATSAAPAPTAGIAWSSTGSVIALGGLSLTNGQQVAFTSTAPGGLTANTTYYVVGLSATSFQVAATPTGTFVTLTGSYGTSSLAYQSGAVTAISSYVSDTWSGGDTTVTTTSSPSSGSTANSLRFNAGGNAVNLTGANTLTSGGILITPNVSSPVSIAGGSLASGTDFIVNQFGAPLTISSSLTGAAKSLTKSGTGTLVLSGNNSFTGGAVYANEGTIQVASTTALGSGNALKMGSTTSVLDLNGYSASVLSISSDGGSYGFTGSKAGLAGLSSSITNSVAGTLSTLSIGGANSGYSGTVTEAPGALLGLTITASTFTIGPNLPGGAAQNVSKAFDNGFYNAITGPITVNTGATLNAACNYAMGLATMGALVDNGTVNATTGQGGSFAVGYLSGTGVLSTLSETITVNSVGSVTDVFNGSIAATGGGYFSINGTGILSTPNFISTASSTFVDSTGMLVTPGVSYIGNGGISIFGTGTLKATGGTGSSASSPTQVLGGGGKGVSTLNGGTLWIAPAGSGGNVFVSGGNNIATSTSTPYMTENGLPTLLLDKGSNTSLTLSLGMISDSLAISAGTLLVSAAHGISALGSTERLNLLATPNSAALLYGAGQAGYINGYIGQDATAGGTKPGTYLTYIGSGYNTDPGFVAYNFSPLNANFTTTPSTGIFEQLTVPSTIKSSISVNSVQIDNYGTSTGSLAFAAGQTLTMNSSGGTLFLNGGNVTGAGSIIFGAGLGVYTSLAGGTIGANLNGNLAATGYLNKYGPGTLTLTGTNNLSGYYLNSGVLDVSTNAASLTNGAVKLAGGVLQTNNNAVGNGGFIRTMGTGVGQISWSAAGGGFSAKGGPLTVDIGNGSGINLIWGNNYVYATGLYNGFGSLTNYFIPEGGVLMFGSTTSDNVVNFQNGFDLGQNPVNGYQGVSGNFIRVVSVTGNTADAGRDPLSVADYTVLSGNISSTFSLHTLSKDGNGVLVLSGSNSYAGGTTIANGALVVGADVNLGTPSTAAYALNVAPGLNGGAITPGAVVINGGATLGANNSFALNSNRTILLASGSGTTPSNINVLAGSTLTFGGLIGDYTGEIGALAKQGGGTLILTGNNVSSGSVTLGGGILNVTNSALNSNNTAAGIIFNGGTLQAGTGGINTARAVSLTGAGTVDSNSNDSVLSGNVTGAGTFTKTGAGTLLLTGSTIFSGATTVNGGTLTVTNPAALQNSAGLTVNGASFNYVTGLLGNTLTLAPSTGTVLTLNGSVSPASIGAEIGNSIALQSGAVAATSGAINLNVFGIPGTTPDAGTGTTYNLVTAPGGGLGNGASYSIGNVYNATNFSVSGVAASGTAISVVVTGVAPATALTWAGGFSVNAGNVWAISDGNGDATGNSNWSNGGNATGLVPGPQTDVTVNGGYIPGPMILGANMSVNSLHFTVPAVLQNTGNTITLNGTSSSGFAIQTENPVAVSLNAGLVFPTNLPVEVDSTALTFGGPITAPAGFTKSGLGTLVMNSPTNAGLTGGFVINQGTVQVGNAAANVLGMGVITFGASNSPTLDLNGNSPTIGLLAGGTNGIVTNNATAVNYGTSTLTFGGSGSQTFGGVIQNGADGFVALTMASGTQILTGSNTYTGVTTINGGVLGFSVAAIGGLPSGLGASSNAATNLILNGGTLQYTGTGGTTDRAFSIGLNGGTFDASGSGAVTFSNAAAITSFGIAGSRTLTLTGTNTGANTMTAAINDPVGGVFSVVKNGSGTWVLATNSGYTGGTVINNGTLKIGGNNYLGSTTAATNRVTFNGGMLETTVASMVLYQGVLLNSPATIQADASLTLPALVSLGSNTLSLPGAGNITVTGTISGAGGLTKSGAGTVTLSNTNSYTGALTLNAGIVNATTAAINGGDLTNGIVFNGGTLQAAAGGIATGKAVTMTGNGTFDSSTYTSTLSGAITGSGTLTKTSTGTLALTGTANTAPIVITQGNLAINNPGSLGNVVSMGVATLESTGGTYSTGTAQTITLTAAGTIQTDAGTLTIPGTIANGANLLTVTGSGNTTVSGYIGTGAGGLTKNGFGTLTLNGSGTNGYTGTTTVNAGTLVLDFSNLATPTNLIAPTSALTLSGGNLSILGNPTASSTTNQTFGTLTMSNNVGTSSITLNANGGAATNLTLTGLSRSVGATLNVNLANDATGLLTASSLSASTLYPYTLVTDGSGTGFGITDASKHLTRYNDVALAPVLGTGSNSATANFSTLNTVYTSGTFDWSTIGNRSANSLIIDTTNAGGVITMGTSSNILTLTTNGILFRGANNETITGGQLGAAASEIVVQETGSGVLTINSPISSGAGSLTKSGTGTLVINGSNAYTGNTTVNAGTLQLASSAFGTGTVYITGNGIAQMGSSTGLSGSNAVTFGNSSTGRFQVNGNTVTIGALSSNATAVGNPVVENAAATSGTLILPSTATQTYAGVIQDGGAGALNLVKSGSVGALILTGSNTFSGKMLLTGGTLQTTTAGIGALTGGIVMGGTANAVTLQVVASSNITTADGIAMSGSGASIFDTNSGSILLNGIVSGTAPLTKIGSGTLGLFGANSYSGPTTISTGVLQINNGTSLGNNAVGNTLSLAASTTLESTGGTYSTGNNQTITLNAATTTIQSDAGTMTLAGNINSGANLLTVTGSGNTTISGTIGVGSAATGAITKNGSGTLTVATSSTLTGITTLNNGVFSTGTLANGGVTCALGVTSNAAANLVLNGGTLQYTGPAISTDRGFTINPNGGGFDASGSGALTMTGALVTSNYVPHSITFSGTSTALNTISTVLIDNGAAYPTSVTKNGSGTWCFTGANTFTGPLTLNGGILNTVAAGVGSSTGTPIVWNGGTLQPAAGAGITIARNINLSGTGNIDTTLTTASGTNIISGYITGTGSLTVNSPTSFLQFANGGATAQSTFSGGVTVNSGTVQAGASSSVFGNGVLTFGGSNTPTLDINGLSPWTGMLSGGANAIITNRSTTAGSLVIGGSGTQTFGGQINGTNTTNLVMNSPYGNQILTGSNTYTGTTSVTSGTLTVANFVVSGGTSNLGNASSAVILGGGATPGILNYTGTATTFTRGFTLNSGTGVLMNSSANLLTESGAVTDGQNNGTFMLSAANSGGITVSGAISGVGNVAVSSTGTGVVLLSVANSYSGVTTINSGILQIGNAASLGAGYVVFAPNSNGKLLLAGLNPTLYGLTGDSTSVVENGVSGTCYVNLSVATTDTFNGSFQNGPGGAFCLNKVGPGTLTLTGTSNYSGGNGTTILGGALQLDFTNLAGAANILPSGNALVLGGGALSLKGNAAVATAQTIGNVTLSGSTANSIALVSSGTTVNLTLGNTWTRNAASDLLIDLSSPGTSLTSTPTANNGIVGYALVKDSTATGLAYLSGGKVVRFVDESASSLGDGSSDATANLSTRNTVYTGGTLGWYNGISARSLNSLTIDTTVSGGTIDLGGTNTLTLTSGAILFKGANNELLTNGQVGANNAELIVHQVGTGVLTIASQIGAGTASVTKDGSGTLVLNGTGNTLSSGVNILGGTVQPGNAGPGVLGVGNVNFAAGNAVATLDLAGNSPTINGLAGTGTNGVVTNSAAATTATLTLSGTSAQTYAGFIQDGAGKIALTKAGSNTQTLTGWNTYTGVLTLNGGILNATTPAINGGDLTNGIVFNSGTLQASANGIITAKPITLQAGGGTFDTNGNTASSLLSGPITGPGTFYKMGTGTLTISGSNSYTGGTYIGNQTLQVNNPYALGTTGTISFGGGGLSYSPLNTVDYSGRFPTTGSQSISLSGNSAIVVTLASNIGCSGTLGWSGGSSVSTLYLTGSNNISNFSITFGILNATNASIKASDSTGVINYNGTSTLQAGPGGINTGKSMVIGGADVFDTNGNDSLLSGVISGAGTSFAKAGLGTLTLNGTAVNSYTGTTLVNGGTLLLDYTNLVSGTNLLVSTSALTLGGGTLSVKDNATGNISQTLGNLTLTANTNNGIVLTPVGSGTTTLALGTTWTRGASSSLLIDLSGTGTGTGVAILSSSAAVTNGIINGGILVKDSSGSVGFGTVSAVGGNHIVRYDDTTGPVLGSGSTSTTANFTTKGSTYTSGSLALGLASGTAYSLTVDTSSTFGTIDLGASTNILTLVSNAILFKGNNNETITGGQLGAVATEVIVHQTSTSGTLTINSLISGYLVNSNQGYLTKDGPGVLVLGGTLNNAANNNGNAYFAVLNQGTLQLGGLALPYNNSGGLLITSGTAQVTAPLGINGQPVSFGPASTGHFQLNGNSVSVAYLANTGASTAGVAYGLGVGIVENASATPATLYLSGGGNPAPFNGVIQDGGSGALSIYKTGIGSQYFAGANTYTGTTTVGNGLLVVSGSITGSVLVSSSATLASGNNLYSTVGPLTVASDVNGGGVVAPGNNFALGSAVVGSSIGRMVVNGNVTLGTAASAGRAHLQMELVGTVAGSGYDQIAMTGASTLNLTNVNLEGSLLNGFTATDATYSPGNVMNLDGSTFYLVIGAGTVNGMFANQSAPDGNSYGYNTISFGGQEFAISYSANSLTGSFSGGHDVALMALGVVPEPGTWALLLGGMGMLGLWQRRRGTMS